MRPDVVPEIHAIVEQLNKLELSHQKLEGLIKFICNRCNHFSPPEIIYACLSCEHSYYDEETGYLSCLHDCLRTEAQVLLYGLFDLYCSLRECKYYLICRPKWCPQVMIRIQHIGGMVSEQRCSTGLPFSTIYWSP